MSYDDWDDDDWFDTKAMKAIEVKAKKHTPGMKWVMKDGKKIELKDMDDSHLTNCINLTRKRIKEKDTWGEDATPNKKALEQLLKERHRRNGLAFKNDSYGGEYDNELFNEGDKQKPKTFLDLLGEL